MISNAIRCGSAVLLGLVCVAALLGCEDETEATTTPTGSPPEICEGAELTAFVGVDVLPMDEEQTLTDHTVVVADGTICQVGPASSIVVPEDAEIIDGAGQVLMPGLADMHIHLQPYGHEQDLNVYVAHGVTTVRNMWGFDWTLSLREQVAASGILGPQIITTGPIMDGAPPIWYGSEVVTTAAEAQQSVTQQVAEGYDAIKVYNQLSLEAYDGIVAEAGVHGVPVVGHVPNAVGLEHALQSGQSSIEHLEGYDVEASDGTLEALTAELGVHNCPTLVVMDKYRRVEQLQQQTIDELAYVHPSMVESWMGARSYEPFPFAALQAKAAELHGLGAPLLAGTDASNPFVIPGVALHEELELLVAAGLSPFEALRDATHDAAQYLGRLDRAGTVEPDKDADLVLLDADPLADISNTQGIAGVMVKGVYYPRDSLQQLLDAVADHYTSTYNLDFDCELPAGYLTPLGADHAVFRVKGMLVGDEYSDYVAREFDVVVNGEPLDVSSYGAMLVVGYFMGTEYVTVRAFSPTESLGEGHGRYYYFHAQLARAVLQGHKDSAEYLVDGALATLWLTPVEIKHVGADMLYKMCPLAASDPAVAASSQFVCHDGNVDFSPGEQLQMAANHALTTDPAIVQSTVGLSGPCTCWQNENEALSCSSFDAS